jgi:hypothetical protein
MKAQQVWQPGTKDMKAIPLPRQITSAKRCLSILVVAAFISIAFIWAYPYPPPDYTSSVRDWLPVEPARELTDGERASRCFQTDLNNASCSIQEVKNSFHVLDSWVIAV